MKRFIAALFTIAVLSACPQPHPNGGSGSGKLGIDGLSGGSGDRCTKDSECPKGETCNTKYGECVGKSGSGGNNGGSTSQLPKRVKDGAAAYCEKGVECFSGDTDKCITALEQYAVKLSSDCQYALGDYLRCGPAIACESWGSDEELGEAIARECPDETAALQRCTQ